MKVDPNPQTKEAKAIVHGRTLEFGIKINTDIVYASAGNTFTSKVGDGLTQKGMTYESKYAFVGAWAKDMGPDIKFEDVNCFDGLNEEGLAAGIFYFPSYAEYQTLSPENQSKGLAPHDFTGWIVANFKSVEEVKNAIKNKAVAIIKSIPEVDGKVLEHDPLTLHYVIYEQTGKSIVIEPVGGELIVHENPLGVITNSPTFDWHMTNLRNYIALNPRNVPAIDIVGETFSQFGQGSGMLGMPGDFTPPARFVRAAVFSQTAVPSATIEKGIEQVFHILNNFDIPVGVAIAEHETDYTMLTTARDPQNLRFYWKTYDDQTIRMVDLNKLMLTKDITIKVLSTEGQQPIEDMTNNLQQLKR
ncbi:choloylglycine hydrolase family protein [Crocosphaera sp. UHCC 0190]|uniref:choloylglycine hydrolase family protein n=1 Tax=Crocosphaera sp. UHCC 0190 TaxID=3110246 RepID=UPI002B1F0121|nr:choloylglycine hydrolase family protein [Crocosphaera sp. UHCC 0190]